MTNLPQLEDFDDPTFDPLAATEDAYGDIADPWPQLRAVAAQGAVQEIDFREV